MTTNFNITDTEVGLVNQIVNSGEINLQTDTIDTNSLKITSGAGVGKILTSDAEGNGVWTDPPLASVIEDPIDIVETVQAFGTPSAFASATSSAYDTNNGPIEGSYIELSNKYMILSLDLLPSQFVRIGGTGAFGMDIVIDITYLPAYDSFTFTECFAVTDYDNLNLLNSAGLFGGSKATGATYLTPTTFRLRYAQTDNVASDMIDTRRKFTIHLVNNT